MALNFTGVSGLFPTSQAGDVGFRTKTQIEGIRREEQDIIPDIAPGEIVLWEKGEGQGEFYHDFDSGSNVYGDLWRGQNFTIGTTSEDGDFALASIALYLYRVGTPGLITLDLTAVDGDGKPTGAVLSTGTTNGSTLTTDTGGELRTIEMSAYTLKASTKYAFYIKIVGGDVVTKKVVIMIETGDNIYTGGDFLYTTDAGSSWVIGAGADAYFDIQGGGKYLLIRTANNQLYQTALTKVP